MSGVEILALSLTIGAFLYLAVALVRPEWFA
jgi:hypothetical protein